MSKSAFIPILILILLGAFPAPSLQAEALSSHTGPGDYLVLHQGPSAFKEGTFVRTHLSGHAVTLTAPSMYQRGCYLSPVIILPRQAMRVVPSWNIRCSKDQGWLVEVQVRNCDGDLSPWFCLGNEHMAPEKESACTWARADIDNIKLMTPVTEVQYRVTLQGKESSPSLTLFALAFRLSPPVPDSELSLRLMPHSMALPVPCRSQYAEAQDIASRVCCPTSTSMVLQYLGVNRSTAEIASLLYNKDNDIYGTWWKPPQIACQFGLRGWVRLFSTWEEVQKVISRGQPIIASISYGKGELKNAPASSTQGHLTVITGFDRDGNVCVNDPALKNPENGPIHYDRTEYGRAWFLHGGVAIILCR